MIDENSEIEFATLKKWRERKCAELNCYNYSMSGIIYCERCYHGAPSRLPENVVAALKQLDEQERGVREKNKD